MKIYKLTVNEVMPEPQFSVTSYISPRTERNVEYYISKDLADKRAKDIYDGMIKLAGFIPRIETKVTEIDVKEN